MTKLTYLSYDGRLIISSRALCFRFRAVHPNSQLSRDINSLVNLQIWHHYRLNGSIVARKILFFFIIIPPFPYQEKGKLQEGFSHTHIHTEKAIARQLSRKCYLLRHSHYKEQIEGCWLWKLRETPISISRLLQLHTNFYKMAPSIHPL